MDRERFRPALTIVGCCLAMSSSSTALPQNVVDQSDMSLVAPRVELDEDALRPFLEKTPHHGPTGESPAAARAAYKLDRHVCEFLDAFPLRPFHCTLGISGYETYFDHPDEMVYALSIATPYLKADTAKRVRDFLCERMQELPPYAVEGFDPRAGLPRESYTVPDHLLPARGRRAATNAFGVFAFWAYVEYVEDGATSLALHWPHIRERMAPILRDAASFDVSASNERDEAERFTGDLAGTIGALRLARRIGDAETERAAFARSAQMLALRINLERVNPRILEVSKTSASHSLHLSKLARAVDLAPCVGDALAAMTDGVAARRFAAFRAARNGWHIAYGPRLVGGENYTSPPHLSRAMFEVAAHIEKLPADALFEWIDIPWCRGDFYFMIKCATALWADGGRRWVRREGEVRRPDRDGDPPAREPEAPADRRVEASGMTGAGCGGGLWVCWAAGDRPSCTEWMSARPSWRWSAGAAMRLLEIAKQGSEPRP